MHEVEVRGRRAIPATWRWAQAVSASDAFRVRFAHQMSGTRRFSLLADETLIKKRHQEGDITYQSPPAEPVGEAGSPPAPGSSGCKGLK